MGKRDESSVMKSRTKGFIAAFLGALAVVGTGCPPGGEVDLPEGVSSVTSITFLIEVWEGESRITGTQGNVHFEFKVLDAVNGQVRNTFTTDTLTLRNGRAEFSEAIAGGSLNIDPESFRYTTYIDLGERGFAEGWVDEAGVAVSLDGTTLIVPVVFDLANPIPDAPSDDSGEEASLVPSIFRNSREGQSGATRLAGTFDRRTNAAQAALSGASGVRRRDSVVNVAI